MSTVTVCPKCDKKYKTSRKPGTKLRCKKCRTVFAVESQDSVAATMLDDSPPDSDDDALNAEMGGKSGLLGSGAAAKVTLQDVESGDSFFDDKTIDEGGDNTSPSGSFATLLTETDGESKYVVDREIARGGMGAILRSIDRDIRREVAMKVMLKSADERTRLRFVEEAQITGQLTHPNIVPVYDLGYDENNQLYFTMKMVKGRSLEEVLDELREHPRTAETRFSLHKLLTVFTKVCDAISFAHSKGVVHRDLKPANIMLGDYGEVLVMDWGLAKVGATRKARKSAKTSTADEEAQAAADEEISEFVESIRTQTGSSMTLDGQVAGTPAYMSPEQAEGKIDAIDERSDIYALGAILYEILCLKAPVQGSTVYEMLIAVSEGKIRPPEKRTGKHRNVPKDLSAVCMKALSKKKKDRYDTVLEMKQDIELYLEGRSVSAVDAGVMDAVVKLVKRNKGVSISVGAAALVVLSISIYSYVSIRSALVRSEVERQKAVAASEKAQKALRAYTAEKIARESEGEESAPAFLRAAKKSAEQNDLEAALLNAKSAMERDPDMVEAQIYTAGVLAVQRKYADAIKLMEAYLRESRKDIRKSGTDAFYDAMAYRRVARGIIDICKEGRKGNGPEVRSRFYHIFVDMEAHELAGLVSQDAKQLVDVYRKRLEESWPGAENLLKCNSCQEISLDLKNYSDKSRIRSLAPLRGMRLTSLNLVGVPSIKSFEPLNKNTLRHLTVGDSSEAQRLDISSLRGFRLESFCTIYVRLADLTPLEGMPLRRLSIKQAGVYDLSALQGMPLVAVSVEANPITDISPLKGMHLEVLNLNRTKVRDFSPLAGMELKELLLPDHFAEAKGLDIIRNMRSLHVLGCSSFSKTTPTKFWKKFEEAQKSQ